MKKILFALVALVALAMLGKNLMSDRPIIHSGPPKLINAYQPGSPLYADHQAFVDRFNANPKLADRFANAISSKGLYAMWIAALNRGARSLPRQQLLQMARTQVAVLPRVSTLSCAKMIRPRDDFDEVLGADLRSAVERLPPQYHRVITGFIYDALVAEVENAPVIAIDQQALDGALLSLGQRYPGEFGQRLVGVLRDPVAASDEDACWAANSLMNTMTQLPDDHAEALLRRSFGG